MTTAEILAVLGAGLAAGTINTVVGSGTLVSFPVLLAIGYPPVVANVSNTVGLVPGSVTGAYGYRRELAGQRSRALVFGACSLLGGITGAVLLLTLPPSAFRAIVPIFIAAALLLIIFQPRISRALAHRHAHASPGWQRAGMAAVYGTGVYGGYFGAAQGIMLLAVFGVTIDDDLQRLNALKNVLAGLVNLVSGIIFVLVAHVAWGAALVLAVGASLGGVIGSRYGRRLPPAALRALIVVIGVVAIVQLL